jgi:hypothetical protein
LPYSLPVGDGSEDLHGPADFPDLNAGKRFERNRKLMGEDRAVECERRAVAGAD